MVQNIGPVRRQHTVTKRVLKNFAGSDGRLAVFERDRGGVRKLLSPGAGIFSVNFDGWDSRATENRWNVLETKFPAAFDHVAAGTALSDPATTSALKDLLSLHWVRSRGMVEARKQAGDRFFPRYQASAPDTRRPLLQAAFRQEVGLIATTRSELEWFTERTIESVRENEVPQWHSEANEVYFQAARVHFDSLDLHLHHAPTGDLLLGDAPVLTTIRGRSGAGPHQNVGIQKVDHVAMPISHDTLLTLGGTPPPVHLSPEHVQYYNDLQWSTFVVWIAAQPGGSADEGLRTAARARATAAQRSAPDFCD